VSFFLLLLLDYRLGRCRWYLLNIRLRIHRAAHCLYNRAFYYIGLGFLVLGGLFHHSSYGYSLSPIVELPLSSQLSFQLGYASCQNVLRKLERLGL
jgi:hypothetical protein